MHIKITNPLKKCIFLNTGESMEVPGLLRYERLSIICCSCGYHQNSCSFSVMVLDEDDLYYDEWKMDTTCPWNT